MTTINPNISQYYTLASTLNSSTTSTGSDSSTSAATDPSILDAFAAVDGSSDDPTNTNNGNSYLLDLSPSAQAYLQNYSGSSSNNSTSSSNGAAVVLNFQQQNTLTAILQKYKDAPYTDATFQQIQNDMSAAGIGADSLAAQAQMRAVNPTLMLLDALNGGSGSVGTIGSSSDIMTQETAFMKQVADQWSQISTTVNDSVSGGTDTTTGGTADAGSSDTVTGSTL